MFAFDDRAEFELCKRQTLRMIEGGVRRGSPEAADYLKKHIVFDDKKLTFVYTGDNRFRFEFPQCSLN